MCLQSLIILDIKMKRKIYILLAVATLAVACTEIIDIDTKKSEPQLVVEANIALDSYAEVLLSKSIQLNAPNAFERLTNAEVRITDSEGKTERLQFDKETQKYYGASIKGIVGRGYQLTVKAEGLTVRSESKIPTQVPIKSLQVINSVYPGGGKAAANTKADFYEILLTYTDPAQQENFYRVKLYVNKKALGGNYVYNDVFNDGLENELNVVIFNEDIKNGDKLMVEFQCIDKAVYAYYSSIYNSGFGPPSSSPANPITNLDGSLLGYFSAFTSERQVLNIEK
jgi:Domain of unknown function (DUF4249)